MALYKLTRPFFSAEGVTYEKGETVELEIGPKSAILLEEPEAPVAKKPRQKEIALKDLEPKALGTGDTFSEMLKEV